MDAVEETTTDQVEETSQVQESNTVIDELKRRDSFKVYVSNLGNFMSQKEVIRLFSDHQIKGIKYSFLKHVSIEM